jgi:hypothetical protein
MYIHMYCMGKLSGEFFMGEKKRRLMRRGNVRRKGKSESENGIINRGEGLEQCVWGGGVHKSLKRKGEGIYRDCPEPGMT